MKRIILLFITVLLLSCSGNNELTKETAMEILKDKNEICTHLFQFSTVRIGNRTGLIKYYGDANGCKRLEEMGFGTVQYSSNATGIILTDEAKQKYFKDDNMGIITQGNVTEILGISQAEGSTTAIVRYKINYSLTPLARLLYKRDRRKCPMQEEKEIELIKFDTGWTIKDDI